jgi:hypothetical protein
MLVGAPLACMDLDGYHLDGGVVAQGGGVARGGGPPAVTGGREGAARGGTGTCANEEFTLYNNAADYEDSSASCTGTYPMYAAVYVVDAADSTWLFSDETTTRSVVFGSRVDLQVQCCWLDLQACSELTTICDVYGISYACTCNPVMTFQLTGDTCPGETVNVCS